MAENLALQLTIKAKDEASKSLGSIGKALGGLGKFAGVGAAAVGAVGLAIGKLALDAAPIEGIRDAFQGLSGDAAGMLAALQEGSLGMVSNTELMKSYNTATQLVSKSFADELPSAMQYLSKVSAATGQDMGFMMDSLVKGIGRMQPLILDNLNVQVTLADAVARASEMFGKEAEELTKAEQQAGMMSITMEALKANTADMPEVVGTAAQGWASFQTTLGNTKDEIGLAFVPVLNDLLQAMGPVVSEMMERVVPAAQSLATWLGENVPRMIQNLVDFWSNTLLPAIQAVQTWWVGMQDTLQSSTESTFGRIMEVIRKVLDFVVPFIQNALDTITTWWDENHEAIFEASRVVFGAVQTTIKTVMEAVKKVIGEVLEKITDWWEEHHELIEDTTRTVFNAIKAIIETVLTAIQTFWQNHGQQIFTIVKTAWELVSGVIKTAINLIWGIIKTVMQLITGDWAGAWETIRATALAAWDGIKEVIVAAIELVKTAVLLVVGTLRDLLTPLWNAIKDKALEAWEALQEGVAKVIDEVMETVIEQIDEIREWIEDQVDRFKQVGKDLILGLTQGIKDAAGAVIAAAKGVIDSAIGAAKRLLGIGSPSKIFAEIGLSISEGLARGIEQGMDAPLVAMSEGLAALMGNVQDIIGSVVGKGDLPQAGAVTGMFKALLAMMEEINQYRKEIGDILWEYIEGWQTAITPQLQMWADTLEPLKDLLAVASSILDVAASEAVDVKLSVGAFFATLLEVMEAINDFRGRGKVEDVLWDYIAGWKQAISPQLEMWAEALKPLQSLLSVAKGVLDLAANEVKDVKLSVTQFFDNLVTLLQGVTTYVHNSEALANVMLELMGDEVGLGHTFAIWADALKPLQPLLSIAKGILDIASNEVQEVKLVVGAFFDNLAQVLTAISDYVEADYKPGGRLWVLHNFWGDDGISGMLQMWADAMKPIQPLLSVTKGILDLAANEVPDIKLSVVQFFDNLAEIMAAVSDYVSSEYGPGGKLWELHNFWGDDGISGMLAEWAEAIKPLQPLLSTVQGILKAAAEEVPDLKLNVKQFFDNLIAVMMETYIYINQATGLSDFVQGFKTNVTPLLVEWADAIKPLQPLLSTIQGVLKSAAEEVQEMKLAVKMFFDNIIAVMMETYIYINQAQGLSDFVVGFQTNVTPILEDWAEALKPLQPLLSTIQGILKSTAEEVQDMKLAIRQFFDNIIAVMFETYIYIEQAKGLSDFVAGFKTNVTPVLEDWIEALKPLGAMLKELAGISKSIAATADQDIAGVFTDKLVPLFQEIYTATKELITIDLVEGFQELAVLAQQIPVITKLIADTITQAMEMLVLDAPENKGALIEFRAATREAVEYVRSQLELMKAYLLDIKAWIGGLSLEAEGFAVGASVGSGLVAGLNSMQGAVAAAAASLAAAARVSGGGAGVEWSVAGGGGVVPDWAVAGGAGVYATQGSTTYNQQSYNLSYSGAQGQSSAAEQMRQMEMYARLAG